MRFLIFFCFCPIKWFFPFPSMSMLNGSSLPLFISATFANSFIQFYFWSVFRSIDPTDDIKSIVFIRECSFSHHLTIFNLFFCDCSSHPYARRMVHHLFRVLVHETFACRCPLEFVEFGRFLNLLSLLSFFLSFLFHSMITVASSKTLVLDLPFLLSFSLLLSFFCFCYDFGPICFGFFASFSPFLLSLRFPPLSSACHLSEQQFL